MPINIEIKARLRDLDDTLQRVAALEADGPYTIPQEDVFFNAPSGRLKLRILAPDRGELIYYERPDEEGPRSSNYAIFRTEDPTGLRVLLSAALGARGTVRKVRTLYLAGRTRIHLDAVEGLGDYLELEVVMAEGEPSEAGAAEAEALMAKLGITENDLVERAYIDLLEAS
jgi:adenylate cyclase